MCFFFCTCNSAGIFSSSSISPAPFCVLSLSLIGSLSLLVQYVRTHCTLIYCTPHRSPLKLSENFNRNSMSRKRSNGMTRGSDLIAFASVKRSRPAHSRRISIAKCALFLPSLQALVYRFLSFLLRSLWVSNKLT